MARKMEEFTGVMDVGLVLMLRVLVTMFAIGALCGRLSEAE